MSEIKSSLSQIIVGVATTVIGAFVVIKLGLAGETNKNNEAHPLTQNPVTSDALQSTASTTANIVPAETATHSTPVNKDISSPGEMPGQFPAASTRYLTSAELQPYSKRQLAIMRNEIFARHGYRLQKNPEMIEHFENMEWYRNVAENMRTTDPETAKSRMSDIERANVMLILDEESKR